MRVKLYPFQEKALSEIRTNVALSLNEYRLTRKPQVVAYTAPTGAGKTIIMSALIEQIYRGTDQIAEQPNAIIVWLSDFPELNKQSRDKIDLKADQIALGQTVMIEDEGFDRKTLEDGKIYFLNTQKIGKDKLLTRHSDSRQYTIWETLRNTVNEKWDHLYFIIDEAHRGMKSARATADATSIMQKFLKGTEEIESDTDNPAVKVPPMPIVIGISATIERFNRFVEGIGSTVRYVSTSADEVRQSGLLKDRIIISYPDAVNNDIAVLEAAVDDWRNKWWHWDTYCREQHYAYVNPVLLVQVQNGSGSQISATDLDVCVQKIEKRAGVEFKPGELAHCFGNAETLVLGGHEVKYVEPSAIADDRNIKVVFFKESLSTGWDCPRAETMMSFRSASDETYVAQLLGRMVRTPLQKRVLVDEELNDVKLFLPHFDKDSVEKVANRLRENEGNDIPTDIHTQSIEKPVIKVYGVKPTVKTSITPTSVHASAPSAPANPSTAIPTSSVPQSSAEHSETPTVPPHQDVVDYPSTNNPKTEIVVPDNPVPDSIVPDNNDSEPAKDVFSDGINRAEIIDTINAMGITSYVVRNSKNKKYYPSLFDLVRLIKDVGDPEPLKAVRTDIVGRIRDHAERLRSNGLYDALAEKVKQFKLKAETFDVFGQAVTEHATTEIKSTSDEDLDRQLRAAEGKLGNEGIANLYGKKYASPDDTKTYAIDVILFVADDNCMADLESWAKEEFGELEYKTRPKTVKWGENYKDRFNSIVTNSDEVTPHNLCLPFRWDFSEKESFEPIPYHLYADEATGIAKFDLNTWERGLIDEEMKAENFVCWLRNPSRKPWALAVPYKLDGNKSAYPDLIIVRRAADNTLEISILEPHNPALKDNLVKAKGFAEYAASNPGLARIQMIRKVDDIHGERFKRLDFARKDVRDLVLAAITPEEFDSIFKKYGFFD